MSKAGVLTSLVFVSILSTAATLTAQQNAAPAGARKARATIAKQTIPHGAWSRGPGVYQVTVCTAGCTINGALGAYADFTFKAWGGGGAGSYGGDADAQWDHGGSGGHGGGGGGYGTGVLRVTVLANPVVFHVMVGAGGGHNVIAHGTPGQPSEVRLTNSGGALVVGATGGAGAYRPSDQSDGSAGVGGRGMENGLAFGSIGHGNQGTEGAEVATCNGGAGGTGGTGAGPGAINNGGAGGHGGYFRNLIAPTCTAKSAGFGLTSGGIGGNGRVEITW